MLYCSTSGTYQAWLNGKPLPLPDSPLPSWRAMHQIPVHLPPGQHRLTFLVDAQHSQQPFLMACLDWYTDSGSPDRLVTDASWRMSTVASALERDTEGAAWRPAWAFDGVWAEPWGMPCNTPDDFYRMGPGWQTAENEPLAQIAEFYPGAATLGAAMQILPDGAIQVHPAAPYPLGIPRLDLARPRLEWYRSREAHSLINNAWLDLFEARAPHLTLDAGAETFARLKVTLRSGGPAILAVTTGESLPETNRYARRVTDLVELKDGETFTTSPTGFRYVKVMLLSAGSLPVVLEPVIAQHIRYPVEAAGTFACSDLLLNEIWRLSARTLHLCMQNEIWDGVKRDQLPWMGDLYTEALAAYAIFGDYRLARRSLAVLAEIGPAPDRPIEAQLYPGLQAVWKIPAGDINNIPSYTLWWVIGLSDYLRYSGDLSLIHEYNHELQAVLEHIAAWVSEDGIWQLLGGWDFIDWSPVSTEERAAYCHLLACRAIRLGADMLEQTGAAVEAYRQLSGRMAAATYQRWRKAGPGDFGPSHHTNAQAVCSGIFSADEALALFMRTLQPDPPLTMTYWHRYLDLSAAEKVGQIQWGLQTIRKYWGQAVQMKMTALWEAFDPAWMGEDPHAVSMIGAGYARYGGYETSLCHGWSAGPAIWLHTAVLGIQPTRPGFAAFRFTPNLGDLQWARGDIPTPHGIIHVELQRTPSGPCRAVIRKPSACSLEPDSQTQAGWVISVSD